MSDAIENTEDVFTAMSPKDVAVSAVIGTVALAAVIGTAALFRRVQGRNSVVDNAVETVKAKLKAINPDEN